MSEKTKIIETTELIHVDSPEELSATFSDSDADKRHRIRSYVFVDTGRVNRSGYRIDIDSLDISTFGSNGAMPFLISHREEPNIDGSPTVLGSVQLSKGTTPNGFAALVADITFDTDDLSAKYARKYRDKSLRQVSGSIMFKRSSAQPIKGDDGEEIGTHVFGGIVREVSAVQLAGDENAMVTDYAYFSSKLEEAKSDIEKQDADLAGELRRFREAVQGRVDQLQADIEDLTKAFAASRKPDTGGKHQRQAVKQSSLLLKLSEALKSQDN